MKKTQPGFLSPANTHVQTADTAFAKKDFHTAFEFYKKAIDADPKHAAAHGGLALTFYELIRKNQNADMLDVALHVKFIISYSTKAINLGLKDAEVFYTRALAYEFQDKPQEAKADYKKALELSPNFVDAHYNLATLYREQGKSKLALPYYDKAIALDAKFAEAYNGRGLVHEKQGYDNLAVQDYQNAIRFAPDDKDAYVNLSHLYEKQGKFTAAVNTLQGFTARGGNHSDIANKVNELIAKNDKENPLDTAKTHRKGREAFGSRPLASLNNTDISRNSSGSGRY